MLYKIWGFHSCDYEECRLLGSSHIKLLQVIPQAWQMQVPLCIQSSCDHLRPKWGSSTSSGMIENPVRKKKYFITTETWNVNFFLAPKQEHVRFAIYLVHPSIRLHCKDGPIRLVASGQVMKLWSGNHSRPLSQYKCSCQPCALLSVRPSVLSCFSNCVSALSSISLPRYECRRWTRLISFQCISLLGRGIDQ
jgi:hypothetical protein